MRKEGWWTIPAAHPERPSSDIGYLGVGAISAGRKPRARAAPKRRMPWRDPWIVAAALFALGAIGWTDRCIARARRVFGKTSRSLRKHRSDRERDPALSRGCS